MPTMNQEHEHGALYCWPESNQQYRHCAQHGRHGPLYLCESYTPETIKEIVEGTVEYKEAITDPEWMNRTDPMIVAIAHALAGIKPREPDDAIPPQ